jgi:hypothetical protein
VHPVLAEAVTRPVNALRGARALDADRRPGTAVTLVKSPTR